ncbi:hypothetical protein DIPPA_33539 [Diplonema papillatum]|nr:hypothetical protein DIPPA_33539 [Diplonema papillatum]|eukprot:gene14797-22653_t
MDMGRGGGQNHYVEPSFLTKLMSGDFDKESRARLVGKILLGLVAGEALLCSVVLVFAFTAAAEGERLFQSVFAASIGLFSSLFGAKAAHARSEFHTRLYFVLQMWLLSVLTAYLFENVTLERGETNKCHPTVADYGDIDGSSCADTVSKARAKLFVAVFGAVLSVVSCVVALDHNDALNDLMAHSDVGGNARAQRKHRAKLLAETANETKAWSHRDKLPASATPSLRRQSKPEPDLQSAHLVDKTGGRDDKADPEEPAPGANPLAGGDDAPPPQNENPLLAAGRGGPSETFVAEAPALVGPASSEKDDVRAAGENPLAQLRSQETSDDPVPPSGGGPTPPTAAPALVGPGSVEKNGARAAPAAAGENPLARLRSQETSDDPVPPSGAEPTTPTAAPALVGPGSVGDDGFPAAPAAAGESPPAQQLRLPDPSDAPVPPSGAEPTTPTAAPATADDKDGVRAAPPAAGETPLAQPFVGDQPAAPAAAADQPPALLAARGSSRAPQASVRNQRVLLDPISAPAPEVEASAGGPPPPNNPAELPAAGGAGSVGLGRPEAEDAFGAAHSFDFSEAGEAERVVSGLGAEPRPAGGDAGDDAVGAAHSFDFSEVGAGEG